MRGNNVLVALVLVGIGALISTKAKSYEPGAARAQALPGLAIGPGAANPPPGIYAIEAFATYMAHLTGPGAPVNANGKNTEAHVVGAATGILIVPGWTVLGGVYNATVLLPFLAQDFGAPLNIQQRAVNNLFVVPAEVSWKFGDSGFYAKAALGIYAPTGDISGVTGLSDIGQPWWTFQPRIVVSYLKDGWNLTANVFQEMKTINPYTQYHTGNILHVEWTATKTFDKWTVGPVGYYLAQVTSDTNHSNAFYGGKIAMAGYSALSIGGFLKYDFGPIQLSAWLLREFDVKTYGGTLKGPGFDTAATPMGTLGYLTMTFRLWDLGSKGGTESASFIPHPGR